MPDRITLECTKGPLAGSHHVFEERTTAIIGRAEDCNPFLPSDAAHATISRHHCLLDINPPLARIRDFGSRNGTYVNELKIGQRPQGREAGQNQNFPEYDLKHGDQIRLGETVYRVLIESTNPCPICGKNLPEHFFLQTRLPSDPIICPSCNKELGKEDWGSTIQSTHCVTPDEFLKQLLQQETLRPNLESGIYGYSIQRELGRGGMGAVYLAVHAKSGQLMALKVMLPKSAAKLRARESFLREAENMLSLKHKNIVQLFSKGESHGAFYFTMEYCNGLSVDQYMKKKGGILPYQEALFIIRQVLDALEYAHQAPIPSVKLANGSYSAGVGLVHRDLKPQNIFLIIRNENIDGVKVGDFGMAKAFDQAGLSGQTLTGETSGTPSFMPRQQVINFKYAKPDVDVWAAAATLYYMLCGNPPRNFSREKDPWQTVLQDPPVPLLERNPQVPAEVARIVDAALIEKPEIRFRSAAEFKKMLERI